MRKVFSILIASVLVLWASTAFGAVAVQSDGTYVGEAVTLNIDGGDAALSGSTVTFSPGNNGVVQLPLSGFKRGSSAVVSKALVEIGVTALGTTPYYYDTGYLPYIYYACSIEAEATTGFVKREGTDASPIVQSFVVPEDYEDTPVFSITCQHDPAVATVITPVYLDWDIMIMGATDTVADSQRDGQTPVVISGTASTTESTKVRQITLTYATATDITAGDIITFRLWPAFVLSDGSGDSTYTSTVPLRIYGAAFEYNAEF